MPGEGLTHGPPANKKAGGSHHRCSRSSGIPCAMVLRLIRDLPGAPGFLAPIVALKSSAQLVASVGATGPHDFAVRFSAVRPHEKSRATLPRPSHTRLTYRDDRACAPLHRGGMAGSCF